MGKEVLAGLRWLTAGSLQSTMESSVLEDAFDSSNLSSVLDDAFDSSNFEAISLDSQGRLLC